jgi:N-acetylneuraminic acid mutarotase
VRPLALALMVLTGACTSDPEPTASPAPRASGLRWTSLSPVPTPRTEVAAAVAGGRIYVAGGFGPPDNTVSVVEVYDITADTWETGPELPIAVNHAMAVAVGQTVYLLGGYLAVGGPSDQAFALSDGGWEALPPMPEPRAAGGAAVAGGRIYVVGGVGPDGVADNTMVFDPTSQRWTMSAGLERPREHMGVAGLGDRVYAVGGRAGSLAGFNDTEVYEPAADSWSSLPPLPTPRGGMAATATSNGFVVAAGGEEVGGTFDEVEAFDIEEERWLSLPPLPTARHGLGVVADGTTVYIIAGGTEPGLSFDGAVETVDLSTLLTPACPGWDSNPHAPKGLAF